MKQLSAVKTEVIREKSKSYHGAPQTILEMRINNKKAAKHSFLLLGSGNANGNTYKSEMKKTGTKLN